MTFSVIRSDRSNTQMITQSINNLEMPAAGFIGYPKSLDVKLSLDITEGFQHLQAFGIELDVFFLA